MKDGLKNGRLLCNVSKSVTNPKCWITSKIFLLGLGGLSDVPTCGVRHELPIHHGRFT